MPKVAVVNINNCLQENGKLNWAMVEELNRFEQVILFGEIPPSENLSDKNALNTNDKVLTAMITATERKKEQIIVQPNSDIPQLLTEKNNRVHYFDDDIERLNQVQNIEIEKRRASCYLVSGRYIQQLETVKNKFTDEQIKNPEIKAQIIKNANNNMDKKISEKTLEEKLDYFQQRINLFNKTYDSTNKQKARLSSTASEMKKYISEIVEDQPKPHEKEQLNQILEHSIKALDAVIYDNPEEVKKNIEPLAQLSQGISSKESRAWHRLSVGLLIFGGLALMVAGISLTALTLGVGSVPGVGLTAGGAALLATAGVGAGAGLVSVIGSGVALKVGDNKEPAKTVQDYKNALQDITEGKGNKDKVQDNKDKVQDNKDKVQGNKDKVQDNKDKVQDNNDDNDSYSFN